MCLGQRFIVVDHDPPIKGTHWFIMKNRTQPMCFQNHIIVRFVFCCCFVFTIHVNGTAQPVGKADKPSIPCRIRIIDKENHWPVSMVELRTTHNVRFVSDNAGLIAFDLPEMMGVPTWFHVHGHGYEVDSDGFGFRGVRLTPRPNETLTIEVTRKLPGKRLGRLTGAGIYAESQKLGESLDWTEQRIVGCDSVQIALHNGKIFWAWGDTQLAGYPLGRFHMIGATTETRPLQSFEPPLRMRYKYFADEDGIPRNIGEMPGTGPTWINGFVSLPDKTGRSRLVGTYTKIKPPLAAYEIGLCEWDETNARFVQNQILWKQSDQHPDPPLVPEGHPTFVNDDDGSKWVLFGDPFPKIRCLATFESWADPAQWQELKPQPQVQSADGKQSIQPHRGSIAWNEFRGCWVTVFTQMKGDSSFLGEIWYAESDSPEGPWQHAVKVVTHDKYTFYNPRLHWETTADDSPILLFEATYTKEFSGNPLATPRYDYNQILYRLDLNDPQLIRN